MCGRFAVTLPPDAMAQLFQAAPDNDLPEVPNYNVCPTTQVHVVALGEAGRQLVSMRWGFLPHWYKAPNAGPLLINARAETIAQKPAFKVACKSRRCLIIATGFYEWTPSGDGSRDPWYICRADGAPILFAGIWQAWGKGDQPVSACAIVTTAANSSMTKIHHRMPVILKGDSVPLWLGEQGKGAARLMQPADNSILQFHRVDRAVNSNRASGAGLIEPINADGA